ncbi:Alpha-D-kanosaminyltransferase [Pseudobythopirellula maris]|uniref:Alpha-D-kanosaminyltransferase n=1 Tax=Pseudobythopirellula maris TaxID=2527991 RepID=A0A5C5ZKF8_9BACT|nr:glycosyltransferase family 4 protein [Pseudobythopirellula maris]TWT87527.1 Alpha-D-kanosaminyltransferase [Pseudobythopirellula maris]
MPEPLRLAYLTSAYGRPSDTFIRNEVDGLRELGCEVQTFSIRKPPEPPFADAAVESHRRQTEYVLQRSPLTLLAAALGLAVRRPGRMLRGARTAWRTRAPGVAALLKQGVYLAEAAWLAGRLRQLRIEHLHNHLAENSANVAMLAAELAGIGFSMTVHGPYIFFAPEKWRLAEKITASAMTVCISHFCTSQCMIFSPQQAWEKLRLVRCSVQKEFLEEPPPAPEPSGTPELVSVGRLCGEKGQVLLVQAAAELWATDERFRLRLIGDGPIRPHIEREIKRLGLGDCVVLDGWRSSSEVRDALAAADAFVIPSFAEGLPVVLMEALAMARPVVTTAIAGVPELVEDGVNGWLAPAGSPQLFAGAMRRALRTPPERRREMGLEGRGRVLRLHHPDRQAERLLELFLEAAGRAPRPDRPMPDHPGPDRPGPHGNASYEQPAMATCERS